MKKRDEQEDGRLLLEAIMTGLDAGSMQSYYDPSVRAAYPHIYNSLAQKARGIVASLNLRGFAICHTETLRQIEECSDTATVSGEKE